jgi:hypothetical protein
MRTPKRLSLQRHFRALTIFAHVESRLSGRKRLIHTAGSFASFFLTVPVRSPEA